MDKKKLGKGSKNFEDRSGQSPIDIARDEFLMKINPIPLLKEIPYMIDWRMSQGERERNQAIEDRKNALWALLQDNRLVNPNVTMSSDYGDLIPESRYYDDEARRQWNKRWMDEDAVAERQRARLNQIEMNKARALEKRMFGIK